MDLFILKEIAFWLIEVRLQKFCKLLLLELDTVRFNQVRLSISLENFSFFWLNFLTPAFTCSINSMSGDLRNNDRWTQSKSRVWSRGQQFRGFCLGLKHHTVSERLGYVPAAAWRETVGLVQFSVPQVSPLKQKWEHCCALRLGCNVPIHVLTIYCCPRDGPFSPLGRSQTFMPLLSPYIWQSWRCLASQILYVFMTNLTIPALLDESTGRNEGPAGGWWVQRLELPHLATAHGSNYLVCETAA